MVMKEDARTGMKDEALARRIASAMAVLAGTEFQELPTPAELLSWIPAAAEALQCDTLQGAERMGRRRSRWRPLVRRALAMGAASYCKLAAPREQKHQEILREMLSFGLDLRDSMVLAGAIAEAEPKGLRTILVLGGDAPLAAAIGCLTKQKVFLVPWAEASNSDLEARLPLTGLDVSTQDPVQPGEALPFWLQGRFQAVVLRPPLEPVASSRAVSMAIAGLEAAPGRRLYWTGHPARSGGYFGIYSVLGKHGLFLERLVPDLMELPLDHEFEQQLLEDLIETPELAGRLNDSTLGDLLAARLEHEHLHVVRPIEEVVLRGHRLELVPVRPKDIPLYDSWLTPEFCAEVGLEDMEPRPTVEQLRVANWYPNHEWWMFRTLEGEGVGIVNLMLHQFWWTRSLPFDIGVAERSFRGKGLLNEAVRLSFARVFGQLGAETLWAIVRVANVRICKGYRSNFFKVKATLTHPETGEEHEHIVVRADEYRELLGSAAIDVPVQA